MKNALKSLGTLALCLCLCACLLPLRASADSAIDKVLCTTSTIPVAQMSAGDISSATSTNGCYIESYGWYDAASGAYIGGLFGTDGVRVSITLRAQEGWYFSENVQVYLNNSSAAYTLGEDGKTLTLVRDYAPELWLPSITKNPGSENVTEGELASFVASATVTSEYKWYLYNPDTGSSYPSDQLSTLFPGTSIGGDGAGKFNIRNVRPDMDGWQVYCIFSGPGGETYSSKATLNVRPLEPTPSPTPEPTPEPTPSPTPEPTATPEADEDEGKLPPDHAHSFPESWRQSEALHWRECDCGAKTGEGSHSFVWELQREASRRESGLSVGECSVCGYRVEKEIAYNNANNILRYILFGLGGLVALTIIVLVIDSIRASRRRRRRRRRRR